MKVFRLEGYNSGGYHSFRELKFDGNLEYIAYYEEDSEPPKLVRYIKVTYPDGTVVHKDNEFLQKLLNEQSYIESFLTIGIEELSKEEAQKIIQEELDNEKMMEEARRENAKKERVNRLFRYIYKARYLLIIPLFYFLGQWLEGPPTRIILISKEFILFSLLLLFFTAMYIRRLNEKTYPRVAWLFHLLYIVSYGYILLYYQKEVDANFDLALGMFYGTLGVHLAYWFESLFRKID